MSEAGIQNDYFEWMCDIVCRDRFAKNISYITLLSYLHSVEFKYYNMSDADRASDGVNLRHRFALDSYDYNYVRSCLNGPCSVLEMILALAIRCEENIMSNPRVGDRTGQWFWRMIANLGLNGMIDERFDEREAEDIVYRFMEHDYSPDGRGGLFMIRCPGKDARKLNIWNQMCLFLDKMM